MNIEAALKEAMNIDGALGVSLVDWESGTALSGSRATSASDLAARAKGSRHRRRCNRRRCGCCACYVCHA